MFHRRNLPDFSRSIVETQLPSKSSGNQIVITSRMVGYRLHPLDGAFVEHYSLLLMDHKEAEQFVNEWISETEKVVLELFINEEIEIDSETKEDLSQRRLKAVESMFESDSKLLMSNPSLLSLICTSIFQSADDFHPKSRIEVYEYAVQSVLRFWASQTSNISEKMLTDFLMDFAVYLHLQSPSGLLDEFDMEKLCCLSLRRNILSNDRKKLERYTKELISSIDSNVGIVAERGLQVFGFLHLSFQEYFVAQYLIRDCIDEIVNRFLTFIIDPRFRESLLLALGWISKKWSSEHYDTFCNLLVTPTKDYAIPLGTLLFFDAFNDIQRLPSNSIIYTALNTLIDHPSTVITGTYFIKNLTKLRKDIIIEWMQLNLKDDQRLFKFCQCLPMKFDKCDDVIKRDLISTLFVVYQQLYSLKNINTSGVFVIDQTLLKLRKSENASDGIFKNELSSYIASHNICVYEIHPLILSVIIAVCGGIDLKAEENIAKIQFLPEQMHRNSSVLASIIEYFDNKKCHSTKIEALINQYESILQKSSPEDTSLVIVDTFIALICLQSVSQPLIYHRYNGYRALPLALDRLKQIWFYLRRVCDHTTFFKDNKNKCDITLEVKPTIDVFFSQSDLYDEKRFEFSLVCAAAFNKLHIEWSSDLFISNVVFNNDIGQYLECQPEFNNSDHKKKRHEMSLNIHPLTIFHNEPFFLLTFVPQSLQQLFYCMNIDPTDSLPRVVLLVQCLKVLEHAKGNDPKYYYTLARLQSLFRTHMLDNYCSVTFWEHYSFHKFDLKNYEDFFKEMIDDKLLNLSTIDQPNGWEILINVERHRVSEALNKMQNQEKDLRLFSAAISLARIFQNQYRPRTYLQINNISIRLVESEEVYSVILNISDPILRILALNIILDMKNPLIFDEEQRDKLRYEMITLLQSLLPDIPLLTSTLLFVWCHPVRQIFPTPFEHMAKVIGEKLNENSIDKQNQNQEAAFIALRELDDADLSPYLSKFAQRTTNLSALLQLNSTIFFHYFINTTSFESSNNILLSVMYLTELAFDVRILEIYTEPKKKSESSYRKQLIQVWDDVTPGIKVMTFKAAGWITDYLQQSNKDEIHQITEDVSHCLLIEKSALSVIKNWLQYRMDNDLRFFAQYAVLQLIKEGLDIPGSINIINDIFVSDRKFLLKAIVEDLLVSSDVDPSAFRQILFELNRNIYYSSKISIRIDSQKVLESFLTLELERISLNTQQSSDTLTKSFLSMLTRYSDDLQNYLSEYLQTFINIPNNSEDTIKDEYLTAVVTWVVHNSPWYEKWENFSVKLYSCIFTILHDRRFPRVQQAILTYINSEVSSINNTNELVFFSDDAINRLEKLILAYTDYAEDVLSLCLLTYGNCLLSLQKFEISRNVSDEMQDLLTILFQRPLFDVISIRAGFCLNFAQHHNMTYRIILNWFENQRNLTVKDKYNILLQQILYKVNPRSFDKDGEEVVEHIQTYSAELIDMFVIDVYKYLYQKRNCRYITDSEPNYVHLALEFITTSFKTFLSAIQKSSFGEEKFKKELCLCFYCTNEPAEHVKLIELYAVFGVFTLELVDMLKWIPDDIWKYQTWIYLELIKDVSGRDVIEKLFQVFHMMMFDGNPRCFFYLLKTLIRFAQSHIVSFLEVHQQVSPIISNVLYHDDYEYWDGGKDIFELLLNLSSIKLIRWSFSATELLTKDDVEEKFKKEILDFEKKSTLFLRRNYILAGIRAISSNSS